MAGAALLPLCPPGGRCSPSHFASCPAPRCSFRPKSRTGRAFWLCWRPYNRMKQEAAALLPHSRFRRVSDAVRSFATASLFNIRFPAARRSPSGRGGGGTSSRCCSPRRPASTAAPRGPSGRIPARPAGGAPPTAAGLCPPCPVPTRSPPRPEAADRRAGPWRRAGSRSAVARVAAFSASFIRNTNFCPALPR